MTNLEKMNELVGAKADKKQIIDWAHMNRIHVAELALEEEFESMFNSIEAFCDSQAYEDGFTDEFDMWNVFLDREFVS